MELGEAQCFKLSQNIPRYKIMSKDAAMRLACTSHATECRVPSRMGLINGLQQGIFSHTNRNILEELVFCLLFYLTFRCIS